MSEFLNTWVLKPELLPAWLQAAAAIVALVISVWAVWWTGAAERRRERLEIRGLAVAVYPEIAMLKISVQTARENLARAVEMNAKLVGQNVAASISAAAYVQTPPMLDRYIDKLFMLGETAGPSCLHLVRLIIQHNTSLQNVTSHMMMMNAEQWKEAIQHIEEPLILLDMVIDKAEHEVRPIHDDVR